MTEIASFIPVHMETVPDTADPIEWAADGCVAHNYHQPVPRYLEAHHVIPRAWQAAWRPGGATAVIWHPETVLLCRTGHGNVHYWIDRFMRHYSDGGGILGAVEASMEDQESVGRHEHVIARRAMVGWQAAGGSLAFLVDRKLWGGLYGGEAGIAS